MAGASQDVFQALFQWAWNDDNIRAIVLTGSRADRTRVIDDLSDFDLTIFVRDLAPITSDPDWPCQFGSIMVRWPLTPQPTFDPAWITQLVLYETGLRIDFQFTTDDNRSAERPGELFCVLVDKDLISDSLEATPIEGTRIVPPTEDEFVDRINAFWWDIPYVAKALSRGEIPYARFILEGDLRFNKIHPLLSWRIASRYGQDTDVGVFGRWFERYLESEIWDRYLQTFAGPALEDQRQAMFSMCELVGVLGRDLAARLGFQYPDDLDRRVTRYLKKTVDG
jgi:aminoglycoside 6-adenylyltransferase